MLTKKALWVNNKRFVRKVMPISPHAPKTRVEEDYAKLLAAKRLTRKSRGRFPLFRFNSRPGTRPKNHGVVGAETVTNIISPRP